MKAKIFMTGLAIMVCSITNLMAQDSPDDRRRTAEEQAAYEKTIKVNPAKIAEPSVDSRMNPAEATAPPVNWKPQTMESDSRPTDSDLMVSKPASVTANKEITPHSTQPAPDPNNNVIDRRSMIGTKSQPAANPQGVKNRRDMVGPKSQPEPKKPE